MKIAIKIFFVFFLSSFTTIAKSFISDTIKTPFCLEINSHLGFIIPHSDAIKNISNTNPFGIETDIYWYLIKNKDWERCNCYSKTGFSLLYIDFDNPILGSATNISVFLEPYMSYKHRFTISFKMGIGVSYINKIYDEITNPENFFFSSHLNFIVYLNIIAQYKINSNIDLKISANYNHISNGGQKKPNKGMNFPTGSLGINYTFDKIEFKNREKTPTNINKKYFYSIETFGIIKILGESNGYDEKGTLIIGLSARVSRTVSKLNALNFGLETISDGSIKEKVKRTNQDNDYHIIGTLIGNEFIFGKFNFCQQVGLYVYAPYYSDKLFFQRYSLSYKISERILIGTTLKTHLQVADNFNIKLGYCF
ncbi:MAG: acyloxyacyl hydrolase [Bacteroidetes bacterium]|nr:acyloxyacyl hydrolase [Bacteroidota bacterium]